MNKQKNPTKPQTKHKEAFYMGTPEEKKPWEVTHTTGKYQGMNRARDKAGGVLGDVVG